MRPVFIRVQTVILLLVAATIPFPAQLFAGNMMAVPELIAHAEEYDGQMVTVSGRVSDLQIATNREGQLAYGFLLKDPEGTLKVIALGKSEVRDGDQVIVEGVFSRHRQVGRATIYNEIKATLVRPMDRLNPDLVG
jgi:cytochrome c-type biogenesis protein CcmE